MYYMTKQVKISIGIVLLLAFANATVFLMGFLDKRQNDLQTSIIQKQQNEETERKYNKDMDEKREIAAILRGEKKLLEGIVKNIDEENKKLVIDIDPLGKQKKYSISIREDAKYFILENKPIEYQVEQNSNEDEFPGSDYITTITDAQFEYIELGQYIEVQFAQRVDIDSGVNLIAKKVTIIKN